VAHHRLPRHGEAIDTDRHDNDERDIGNDTMKRWKRIAIALATVTMSVVLGCVAIMAAWVAGIHVPLASGTTFLRVEKLSSSARVDRAGDGPTAPFFILLIGSDLRPGVGGARGDALHLLGVNPAQHAASMLDIPRDTCWHSRKINEGNTRGPRSQADDVAGLTGVNISYVVEVDFAGFTRLVNGVGGVDVNVPFTMHDHDSGAYFSIGRHHMDGAAALAFSRDRHDFPQSDIIRTNNQGLLILDAMRQLRKQMQNAPGEFRLLALLGRHAKLDGIGLKDLYRLSRTAFAVDPNKIKNVTIPIGSGGCLGLGGGASSLFADFRDDGILEMH
jgi:LCP family protein required for cell wall assembly